MTSVGATPGRGPVMRYSSFWPSMWRKPESASGISTSAGAFGAQLETLDLSGRRLRQVFAEFDPARIFERREFLLHVFLQCTHQRIARLVRRFQYDEGFRLDQLLLVVPADDGRFENIGMRTQRRLDL